MKKFIFILTILCFTSLVWATSSDPPPPEEPTEEALAINFILPSAGVFLASRDPQCINHCAIDKQMCISGCNFNDYNCKNRCSQSFGRCISRCK